VTTQAREPLPPPPLCLWIRVRSMEGNWDQQDDEVSVGAPWKSQHPDKATEYFGLSRMLTASCTPSQKDAVLGGLWKRKAGLKMELPPLPSLGDVELTTSTDCSPAQHVCVHNECASCPLGPVHTLPKPQNPYPWPPTSPTDTDTLALSNPFGIVPPLTPPHELESLKWPFSDSGNLPDRTNSLSPDATNTIPDISAGQQPASAVRPSTISLPGFVNMAEQSNAPSAWLERAIETISELYDLAP
jgi:hypothetical protein